MIKPKICAGIVTYNPDIKKLKTNIDHIISQVEMLVLCDNGSKNIREIKSVCKANTTKIKIIELTQNLGISAALNCICKWSLDKCFNWVLTLDQDSVCPDNLVLTLAAYCQANIAVVAPHIIYRNNEEFSLNTNDTVEEVKWVITSASLTNLVAWQKIAGFDEILFIDKVDYDFCVRARKSKFKIIRVNTVALLHELGNLKCRKLFGRTIYVTNHKPFRKYYMTRNSIYLWKKLRDENPIPFILKNIFKVIIFEDEKLDKLKSILSGIATGIGL